jgi:hypothetical protein
MGFHRGVGGNPRQYWLKAGNGKVRSLEAWVASLRQTHATPAPTEPSVRPPKSIALTLRLDPQRYGRLSEHAARFAPRRSFQTIIVTALDAYLDEQVHDVGR